MLSASGLNVHGIDASRPMVQMANELAGEASLSDALVFNSVPTVESLPFPDHHFDGCICLSVLEYLDRPNLCLDELQRVLKPDGLLILSVPHRHSPIRLLQRLIFGTLRAMAPRDWEYTTLSNFALTRTELASKLRARGFALRRIAQFDAIIPSFARRVVPPSLMFVVAQKGQLSEPQASLSALEQRAHILVRSNEPEIL
jgi:2-polyprenyl-6-hydroxyphenyl methylase/3-demethylubiquinone-9 3-methyltransferase